MASLLSGIAALAIRYLVNGIINPEAAGRTPDGDAIVSLAVWVQEVTNDFAWVMGQENGAVTYSAQYAKQIGHDLEQIQGDQQAYWNRLIDVILPQSFAHLVSYVYTTWVVPIQNDLKGLHAQVEALVHSVNALDAWKNGYVDPELSNLLQFEAYVQKDWTPIVNTVADWLTHPEHFGTWAAPPIIGPIVAYLADPVHKTTRDNLSAILAGAWSEEAERVWEDVQAWLVAST